MAQYAFNMPVLNLAVRPGSGLIAPVGAVPACLLVLDLTLTPGIAL